MQPGETWNESVPFRDSATARPSRQLTSLGVANNAATYHLHAAFSADSRYLAISTVRRHQTALLRADVESGELTTLAVLDNAEGGGLDQPYPAGSLGRVAPTATTMVQARDLVVAPAERELFAVPLHGGPLQCILGPVAHDRRLSAPYPAPDGSVIYVPETQAHPDIAAGRSRIRPGKQAMIEDFGGKPTRIWAVPLDRGEPYVVYDEPIAGCNHVQVSPTDPDLLLVDRDLPPTFEYYGDNCESPRVHLYNVRSGELTPVCPHNRHQFQSHANFNRDGIRVYYHGPAYEGHEQPVREGGRTGEMFVGASDLNGESVFEINYPAYYYGHVSTDTRGEAIVTDGLVSNDLIVAIHYEQLDRSGAPRIELLARHDSRWRAMAGQYPHPHPHVSPDGRWLAYNRAHENGRCDVCVTAIA